MSRGFASDSSGNQLKEESFPQDLTLVLSGLILSSVVISECLFKSWNALALVLTE